MAVVIAVSDSTARAQPSNLTLPAASGTAWPTYDFGGVAAGQSRRATFSVRAVAPVRSITLGVSPTGGPYQISPPAFTGTISPGASFAFNVDFAPLSTQTGPANATVTIAYNTSLTVTMPLTGTLASPGQDQQGTEYHEPSIDQIRVPIGANGSMTPVGDLTIVRGNVLDAAGHPVAARVLDPAQVLGAGPTPTVVASRIEITASRPHANPYNAADATVADRTEYQLAMNGTRLCAAGTGWALAFPGYWEGGSYVSSAEWLSFACIPGLTPRPGSFPVASGGGVVAKCIDWGHKPWDGGEAAHAACVRMAMADYCGDGLSGTVDGTLIDGYARGQLHSPLPARSHEDPPLDFEAAWTSHLEGGKHTGRAVCLSKRRWSTLPFDSGCPSLPDPRVGKGAPIYCEDLQRLELEKQRGGPPLFFSPEVLFYNYSAYVDAGLYLCGAGEPARPTWTRWSTTTGVDYQRSPHSLGSEALEFYAAKLDGGEVSCPVFVGTVFHKDVMAHKEIIPPQFPPRAMIALCRAPKGGATRVASSCDKGEELDGWVWKASAGCNKHLREYVDEALYEYTHKCGVRVLATERSLHEAQKHGLLRGRWSHGSPVAYTVRLR